MSTDPSQYQVSLFREKGFTRRECVKCGKHYWSLDPERTTCGDPPCDEYSFIGAPPTKKKYNLHEMRETYLKFFEKNGHTRVSRYPIVARWRSDVFFTQASIYCFQPWVILGVVKPPANPLTISQPCVRFNDIDNVGKTGRHFTMFEMMAHHCFNTKDNQIYFKDRTVELCHRLLTEELGIPPEAPSYIEADWAGGGNSGPCFETLVNGIELSTLVFMMYEEKDGVKKEMDMQVVDTGYGLERFTWITQGTSSAYEAVFDDVLKKLKSEAHITGDEKILSEYSKVAGLMNVESNVDLKILRQRVAERLGIRLQKLEAEIGPMENLYAVCDHTRAMMFMFQDGVVPSNVKEGYFARMLVRRAVRALSSLKLSIPIKDILSMQIDYFKKDFPELAENRDDLLNLADVEEEKYRKTVEKGRAIVARMDENLRKEGKKELGLDSLISLYDSQGLTPDLVREFTELKVTIPDDFYVKVAARHERPEAVEETVKESIKVPAGIRPTVLGFYEDSQVQKFNATVVSVFGNHIVLDKTYFYPEGGGQESDIGTIDGLHVYGAEKSGGVVVHSANGDVGKIKKGAVVECVIDWSRRTQLAQHHTSTHIINGAARKLLGAHVWQTGAHKSVKGARLDITHYAALSDEELCKIESLANKAVAESRPIDVRFMERSQTEKQYGFRLYQGGVVPGGEIRVVNIKDWDVEACGGIHLSNTKDAGLIKITGSKRIQDGVVRIEFVAGAAAESYLKEQKEIAGKISGGNAAGSALDLEKIAAIFSVPVADLPKTLERFRSEWNTQREELKALEKRLEGVTSTVCYHSKRYVDQPGGESYQAYMDLFEQWKSQRKDLELLRQEISKIFSEGLEKKLDGHSVVKELVSEMSVKDLTEIARKAVKNRGKMVIIVNEVKDKANVIVASTTDADASDVAKRLSKELGGGGHGDKGLAAGGGSSKNAKEILERFIP